MATSSARKLPPAARDLVRSRIIAGDDNTEIRAKLKQDGYPCDITDQAFTVYRQDPEVLAARQLARQLVAQIGVGDFSRRINALVKHANNLHNLIYFGEGDDDGLPRGPQGKTGDVVALSKEWRETVKQISDELSKGEPFKIEMAGGLQLNNDINISIDGLSAAEIAQLYLQKIQAS